MLKTESRQGTLPGAPSPGKFSLPNLQVLVMLGAIVVIALFFTWTTDGAWLSPRNVSNLLRQTAITGILAVGMVFVIISAEIDLSVGLSLIHISEPTRPRFGSRMPSSA